MQKATRQQTKDHNTRLVLKTIFDQGELSRADIARITGLTRPTVSTIVADLLASDYVIETGIGPSVGGKPPTFLAVKETGRQLICLDLSGAEFRGALVDLQGTIIHRVTSQLADRRGEAVLATAADMVASLQSIASAPVLGIAVATPGLVDPRNGVVLRAVNLDWRDMPLRSQFEDQFGVPVHVANDSHLAALAEFTFGPERPSRNLITIRVGQGIGAGIVLNGQPFYGDGFGADEIGHVVVAHNGELCSCGNFGCLETTSSTRAMLRQAHMLAGDPITSWEAFVDAVQAGNEAATNIVAGAGRHLGAAVANLIGGFNITTIILAGRISQLGDALLDPMRSEMRHRVLPSMADETTVAFSTLGSDIIVLGGSALLLQRELGIVG
ncbi:MAG: ROK family transcriptional regulator [Chloroflexota bacterium]